MSGDKEQNEDKSSGGWHWSYSFLIAVICIWVWKYYLPDQFPEYFDRFSCRGAAPTAEDLLTKQLTALNKMMSRVGLGQSDMDPTVKEIRELPKDPANPLILQCSMTYEVYSMRNNAVVTEEFNYSVVKRADGEGYLIQGRL